MDGIRIEKVPTRFNLPALLASVRVVLRHAARHAQRGGDSGQDRYNYLKYSFPGFFLHRLFFSD